MRNVKLAGGIIAGGTGSRLQGISQGKPKCLMPFLDSVILAHQLDFFRQNNVTKIYLFLGFGSDQIITYLQNESDFEFVISIEDSPRGTGGKFLEILNSIESDILLIHGDLFIDFPLHSFFDAIENSHLDIDFLQLVHPSSHMLDSDIIETNEENQVVKVHAKPHLSNLILRNQTNAGVYYFTKSALRAMSSRINSKDYLIIDLDREFIPLLIRLGFIGVAVRNTGFVRDLGTVERLREAENIVQLKAMREIRPMVLLDRDGVINRDLGWLKNRSQLQILTGVPESIGVLNKLGFRVCVITNQPVIARGEASYLDVKGIHDYIDNLLAVKNAYIDEYFICPHHPDAGYVGEISNLKIHCTCRKPEIGLIEQAFRLFKTDVENSWFIGDSWRDEGAANTAGIKFIKITNDPTLELEMKSLQEAVSYIASFPQNRKFFQ